MKYLSSKSFLVAARRANGEESGRESLFPECGEVDVAGCSLSTA